MSELIETLTSWQLLLLAIVVYGFAPGFALRLIVRLYPPADPRRAELVAELYTIKRLWRPFWVAEQLETALFEGLPTRFTAGRSARRTRHLAVLPGQRDMDREVRHARRRALFWAIATFLMTYVALRDPVTDIGWSASAESIGSLMGAALWVFLPGWRVTVWWSRYRRLRDSNQR